MKRFVLNHVFCLLLITIFIFVTTPAMAVPVEITVTLESYTADDTNTTPANEQELVIKLTYSEAPNPKPTVDDLTFTGFTGHITLTTVSPSVSLADGPAAGDDNNSTTYFITWTGSPTTSLIAGDFNDTTAGNVAFVLRGYELTVVTGFDPLALAYYEIPVIVDVTDAANDATPITDNNLVPNSGYLPGLGYVIVVEDKTDDDVPTLPTNSPPFEIIRADWSDVSDETMPNLWLLFQNGGTLNLRVNEPGTTNRLGSKKADDTYDDDHGRNQRQVVINEVMWAQDEGFIGNLTRVTEQQWIELHNRTTFPIPFAAATEIVPADAAAVTYSSDIKLITSRDYPAPPAETDRLTNVPTVFDTWNIVDIGQHGSSETPRRDFKSMKRVNYTNGWNSAHWSISTNVYLRGFSGTPGTPNQAAGVPTARRPPAKDIPAKNKIIINEIGNFADDSSDWIELRNVTGSAQSLNNWVLTKTIGFGNESEIVRFPDYSIEPNGVLLLVNKVPWQTPLSLGFDIQEDAINQEFGAAPHRYLILEDDNLAIPNDDAWLLILRSNTPWDVGSGRDVYQTGFRVEDVVGPGAFHAAFEVLDGAKLQGARREKQSDGQSDGEFWHTKVFPLNGYYTEVEDDFLQSDRLNAAGQVWVRDGAKQGFLKDSWHKAGFTGIGYDRSVRPNDQYGGTPGYDNNFAGGRLSQLQGGKLIVSELMLTTSNDRVPQWIELYNTSRTRAIDLAADSSDPETGWQLIIENHDSGSWKENKRHLNITVNLKDLFTYIPPNQTVLIVAAEGRPSNRNHLPDTRVASVFHNFPNQFSMTNQKDLILNAEGGFHIKIVDGDGTVSDEVGNLDGVPVNLHKGIGLDDPYSWNWPTALTEDGDRTSLIRLRDSRGRPRAGVPNRQVKSDLTGAVLPMGTKKKRPPQYAWVHAVDTAFKRVPKVWYGESRDISTPGFVRGIQLPVSLSFFRAALESGEVVIRWTTESETDNAGFNILRSHRKDGEYKQINTALIQGAGTTGERNTYKWVDPTAKAGVVYYYQIEDVSFAE